MANSVSLAVLVGGIVLILFGLSAATSLSSDFSHLFTGFPTDRSMWMLAGGTILSAIGLVRFGQGST